MTKSELIHEITIMLTNNDIDFNLNELDTFDRYQLLNIYESLIKL